MSLTGLFVSEDRSLLLGFFTYRPLYWCYPTARRWGGGTRGRRAGPSPAFAFGLHVVILMAQWDGYRVPLALRLVKAKGSKGYQSENALFREMLQAVVLPAWCKQVVVVADAASPSRANLQVIQARGWFFVMAFPRTWKLANGHHLRDLVTHLPLHQYRQESNRASRPPEVSLLRHWRGHVAGDL
jgi:hypothetical protein